MIELMLIVIFSTRTHLPFPITFRKGVTEESLLTTRATVCITSTLRPADLEYGAGLRTTLCVSIIHLRLISKSALSQVYKLLKQDQLSNLTQQTKSRA